MDEEELTHASFFSVFQMGAAKFCILGVGGYDTMEMSDHCIIFGL